jgi:hypothetical protein
MNAKLAQTATIVSLCALCGLSVHIVAQDKTPAKQQKPKAEMITLSGCIVHGEHAPGQYTLDDKTAGTFRLTGADFRDYLGRRVQIIGGIPSARRLTIKGGLTPNPNVAAQAGAMDPARAAVAAQGGAAGPGTVELPEFKVKSVRPISGSCE